MPSKEMFEHESIQDNQTIGRYLNSLKNGFESGRILLESEGQQIVLYPNDLLDFHVQVKKKKDKSRMTLKLSWKDSKEGVLSKTDFAIKTDGR